MAGGEEEEAVCGDVAASMPRPQLDPPRRPTRKDGQRRHRAGSRSRGRYVAISLLCLAYILVAWIWIMDGSDDG